MVVRSKHLLLCQRKTFVYASCASRFKQFKLMTPRLPGVSGTVLSAKKSPKLTFTKPKTRRFCNSTIDPDACNAVLRYKVLAWLIYHNMTAGI